MILSSDVFYDKHFTSPPSWRAQTVPPPISFLCNVATEARADFTLVYSTAEALKVQPSCSRPGKNTTITLLS